MTNQQHDTNTIPEPTITEEMKRFIVTRRAQGLSTAAAVDELLQKFEELQTYIQHSDVDVEAYREKRIERFLHYRITHSKFPKKYISVWEEAQTEMRTAVIDLQAQIERFKTERLEIIRLVSQIIRGLSLGNMSPDVIESILDAIDEIAKKAMLPVQTDESEKSDS